MKIRNGFISNSSSSSFLISMDELSESQINMIKNCNKFYNKIYNWKKEYSFLSYTKNELITKWNSRIIDKNILSLYTEMDNFPLIEFLASIQVPLKNILYGKKRDIEISKEEIEKIYKTVKK